MFSRFRKKNKTWISSSGQKTGSHMSGVFISGTYRQTCSLSGSINLNWTSTSICLILSRLQLLLKLMWHAGPTGLPFPLSHVVFIIRKRIKIIQLLPHIYKCLSENVGGKEMEITLICTWLRKKANSEFALTYKYFWKQKYPFSPKTQNPMGVFPKYTQHAAIQGTLCMFLCGRLLLCPCYFCQGQGDPVSVIWDEIARCSSCTFTSRKT